MEPQSNTQFRDALQAIKDNPANKSNQSKEDLVLTLFGKLDKTEQFKILDQCTTCILKNAPGSVCEHTEKTAVNKEIEDLETFNTKEMIKLKYSIIKMICISVCLVLMIVLVAGFAFEARGIHTKNNGSNEILAIFGYLFGK